MFPLAQNEAINAWLDRNPVVLGLGAVAFGVIFFGLGVYALWSGHAPTKKGDDLEGGQARVTGVVWLVMGAACLVFGAFKIVTGLR